MTPEFNEWWDSVPLTADNPYQKETPIYWAWEGWQAARKREWKGLKDGDIAQAMYGSVEGSNMLPYQFARAIEAKLREKNT
jgi:hypothetical protein